jgi:hypothetical protein
MHFRKSTKQIIFLSKKEINGTWEDATVETIILREWMGIFKDTSYINKEVTKIDYPAYNQVLGDITVYVDKQRHKIIGFGFRE